MSRARRGLAGYPGRQQRAARQVDSGCTQAGVDLAPRPEMRRMPRLVGSEVSANTSLPANDGYRDFIMLPARPCYVQRHVTVDTGVSASRMKGGAPCLNLCCGGDVCFLGLERLRRSGVADGQKGRQRCSLRAPTLRPCARTTPPSCDNSGRSILL